MRQPTLIDRVMNEYILIGGPTLTRAEAYRHLTNLGVEDRARDYFAFATRAVEPPDDPEAQIAFARQIEALERARA